MSGPVVVTPGRAGESGPRSRRPGLGGFSLVEVLVGLLVLELGLLGVAGLVALSGRILTGAARTERALFAAEDVLDSLTVAGDVSDGERAIPGGTVRWRLGPAGGEALRRLKLVSRDDGGRPILTFHALVPEPPAAEEEG